MLFAKCVLALDRDSNALYSYIYYTIYIGDACVIRTYKLLQEL